jgi:hypothetical protein
MTTIPKTALAGLALAAATLPAHAISRYNSESLTCAEAQSIVIGEGAAILRYRSENNPSLTRYDRFVRNSAFCQASENAKTDWVPTADTRSCPVLKCQEKDFEDQLIFGID